MAISDTWHKRDGSRSALFGKGMRWRVRWHDFDKSFEDTPRKAITPDDKPPKRVEAEWFKVRTAVPRPAHEVTVGELVDRWLLGKKGLSKSRQDGCDAAAARVKARWGAVLAADVLEQDVREWQASIRDVGASSIRKAMECLSGAMKLAVKMGAAAENPCVEVKRPAEPKRDARFLSPTELELLADSAGPDRPMVLLMGTTGIRIGEACNLRVGDVDRRRRRLWVASRTAKSRKGREVGIPTSVIDLLPLRGRVRTDWVFLSRRGGRVDEHNWRNRHFFAAVERAQLGEVNPHDLRHTAVSLAIQSGADIKVVQQVAGHASAKLTLDTYGHLFDQGIDDVARRMDGLFRGDGDAA